MDRVAQHQQEAPGIEVDLESWPMEKRAEAGRHIESLMKHPGWNVLCDAIGQHSTTVYQRLSHRQRPLETTAEYAQELGSVHGMSQIHAIAQSVVDSGREARDELKAPA